MQEGRGDTDTAPASSSVTSSSLPLGQGSGLVLLCRVPAGPAKILGGGAKVGRGVGAAAVWQHLVQAQKFLVNGTKAPPAPHPEYLLWGGAEKLSRKNDMNLSIPRVQANMAQLRAWDSPDGGQPAWVEVSLQELSTSRKERAGQYHQTLQQSEAWPAGQLLAAGSHLRVTDLWDCSDHRPYRTIGPL